MGVVLYRPGNTHKVNGIECELRVFDEYSFAHNLEIGWHLTPESCYNVIVDPKEIPVKKRRKK